MLTPIARLSGSKAWRLRVSGQGYKKPTTISQATQPIIPRTGRLKGLILAFSGKKPNNFTPVEKPPESSQTRAVFKRLLK